MQSHIHLKEVQHPRVPGVEDQFLRIPGCARAQEDHGGILSSVGILGKDMGPGDHDAEPLLNLPDQGVEVALSVRMGEPAAVLAVDGVTEAAGQQPSVWDINDASVTKGQPGGRSSVAVNPELKEWLR